MGAGVAIMSEFKLKTPQIHPESFVAEGARLLGGVILREGASVWFNGVLRADLSDIVVGENSNVQDNCVIHVEADRETIIGRGVTIGHSAIIHGCTIGDDSLIGMGAIVLDGSVIPRKSLVAAGSVVPPNRTYPEGYLIIGTPAKALRKLSPEEIEEIAAAARLYRELWGAYVRDGIGRTPGGNIG
jgi:carbonic anhydrase/acetyltransferase-like protein (isoleucine patch superfamily)